MTNDNVSGFKGMPVLGIIKGEPAEKAGIKIGDKIIAINDIPTRDGKEYFHAFSNTPAHEKTLTVFRASTNEVLILKLEYPNHKKKLN